MKNFKVDMLNDEIVLQQGNNEIRIPVQVKGTEEILDMMQSPSYADLQQEAQAHRERQGAYRKILDDAEQEHKQAIKHFQDKEQGFFLGKASLEELEQARTAYQESKTRLEQMKETYSNSHSLQSVTEHSEDALYDEYRRTLSEVDAGAMQQLKDVRESLATMLKYVDEKINDQNINVWKFNQELTQKVFKPRGHRASLYGHYVSRPKANIENNKKRA